MVSAVCMQELNPQQSRSVGGVKQLEAARNTSLKEAGRIILLADGLQLRLVRRTVRGDRILEPRGIVQELVTVEKTGGRRGFVNAVDQGLRDGVDGFVVPGLSPGHREAEDDEMIRGG